MIYGIVLISDLVRIVTFYNMTEILKYSSMWLSSYHLLFHESVDVIGVKVHKNRKIKKLLLRETRF